VGTRVSIHTGIFLQAAQLLHTDEETTIVVTFLRALRIRAV
jgi:hypothetical protein